MCFLLGLKSVDAKHILSFYVFMHFSVSLREHAVTNLPKPMKAETKICLLVYFYKSDPRVVLILFSAFLQFEACCSYKVVLIKKCIGTLTFIGNLEISTLIRE